MVTNENEPMDEINHKDLDNVDDIRNWSDLWDSTSDNSNIYMYYGNGSGLGTTEFLSLDKNTFDITVSDDKYDYYDDNAKIDVDNNYIYTKYTDDNAKIELWDKSTFKLNHTEEFTDKNIDDISVSSEYIILNDNNTIEIYNKEFDLQNTITELTDDIVYMETDDEIGNLYAITDTTLLCYDLNNDSVNFNNDDYTNLNQLDYDDNFIYLSDDDNTIYAIDNQTSDLNYEENITHYNIAVGDRYIHIYYDDRVYIYDKYDLTEINDVYNANTIDLIYSKGSIYTFTSTEYVNEYISGDKSKVRIKNVDSEDISFTMDVELVWIDDLNLSLSSVSVGGEYSKLSDDEWVTGSGTSTNEAPQTIEVSNLEPLDEFSKYQLRAYIDENE